MEQAKYWMSMPPANCQISGRPIVDCFIDGKTIYGPWACMHPEIHSVKGVGLGTGIGQQYTKQPNGRWMKTAG